MNPKNFNPRFIVLGGMILAAAFTRLIPHPPNFTAIGAMALFGGAYFNKKILAFVVPLAAMFLSDLIIGFHPGMYVVYISFMLIVLIGMTLRNNRKVGRIVVASVSASVLFFVTTNFAQWITDPFYPKTAAGLMESYTMAIPFFQYTFLGDLVFAGAMFGIFELARTKFPSLAEPKVYSELT